MASFFCSSTFPALAEISDEELTEIGTILGMWRSFDISVYKDKCMKRRVAIRIRATRCSTVADYCCLLRENEKEQDLLLKVLTIHVSQFFRNPSMFEKLRRDVFPGLFSAAAEAGAEALRLLCLGCAGGEEPYSLAILLREHFSAELRQMPVCITGSDIDAATLVTARQGEYSQERLKEVPAKLMARCFGPHAGRFRLNPEIREMVSFVQGNITCIAPQQASDLVLCRNTLIYFTRPDQEKILNGIAGILQPGGILVLGKSEILVGDARQRFMPVCLTERIYRKV
jgi:chemotaxis protein methyltransferase CheR